MIAHSAVLVSNRCPGSLAAAARAQPTCKHGQLTLGAIDLLLERNPSGIRTRLGQGRADLRSTQTGQHQRKQ
jgi:hypothetical protein